jgi:hypothetical protein
MHPAQVGKANLWRGLEEVFALRFVKDCVLYGSALRRCLPLSEILPRIRKLRGAVALSYKNDPTLRKQICKRPFHCVLIKKSLFKNTWTELLAIKPAAH